MRLTARRDKKGRLLPTSVCLNCGKELDAASQVRDEDRPKSGDVTVCIGCGHLMAYGDDMVLRELTDDEIIEVAGDPGILEAVAEAVAFTAFYRARGGV